MAARLGTGTQKADFDIAFGAVQLVGSMRMTAAVAFGSARDIDLGGNLPFFTICNAVKCVHVAMAICHFGNLGGGCGLSVRGMIVILLRLSRGCSCVFALAPFLESKAHVISLVGIDTVPCTH